MKHLLSGVALAALLAAGLPAPAQTSSTAPSGTSTAGATMPSDSTGTSGQQARKSGVAAKHTPSPGDNMAEELNRQELRRAQSGSQTTGSGQSQAPGAGGGTR